MSSRMVFCDCPCKGYVDPRTRQRHREGRGPLRVVLAQLEDAEWREWWKQGRREKKRRVRQYQDSSRPGQSNDAVYM